jgi:2,4-dienoyl-CoA reductase-like NADH-dependent reductase (Old Yellow Enzyme family)/thioredoxin reductase
MSLDHLFKPIRVGSIEIRNRILSTGHQTIMVHDGKINEHVIAYHEARAKGGAGLIIAEIGAVHETAFFSDYTIKAYLDDCIPGYRMLAEAVHKHGGRIFGQLFHPGREVFGLLADGTRPVSYAPSEVPPERFLSNTVPLTEAMIEDIIEGYASSAARLRKAGLDGVEIVASHSYLPAQFMNPRINFREDAYGGNFENRLRFTREVVRRVRAAVGPEMVVGMRMSGDEVAHDGLSEDESFDILAKLDEDRSFDYFNVIAGSSSDVAGAIHIVPPMWIDNGYVAPFAKRMKAAVGCAVFVGGRINQPQMAENIIANGEADMCAMTRAMICDPSMPSKAQAGKLDDIRACIACNQACIGHMQISAPISCIQFPETGRELGLGKRRPIERRRRVMIVGGGPAGLKAAAVAAERGHDVTLYERARQVGGQALLAQMLPGRMEFGGIVTNLRREAERAGAAILTSVDVTKETIVDADPEVIVLAAGAVPRKLSIEGQDDAHVVNAWQALQGTSLGQSVIVADFRGDWIGMGLAEKFADEGHRVRYFTSGHTFGQSVQSYIRDLWHGRLRTKSVDIVTHARLVGLDSESAYFQHTASKEYFEVPEVNSTILSLGHQRENELQNQIGDLGIECHVIGDCLSPRTAEEAVLDGLRTGNEI